MWASWRMQASQTESSGSLGLARCTNFWHQQQQPLNKRAAYDQHHSKGLRPTLVAKLTAMKYVAWQCLLAHVRRLLPRHHPEVAPMSTSSIDLLHFDEPRAVCQGLWSLFFPKDRCGCSRCSRSGWPIDRLDRRESISDPSPELLAREHILQ